MFKTILLLLPVFVSAWFTTAQTSIQPAELKPLNGLWKGDLIYRDYSSDERVSLPLVGNAYFKGEDLHLEFIINEGKVYRQHYAYQVKDGSIVFEGPWTTEAKAGTISGGDFRLVLTKRGRDGNQRKPCTFRLTFSGGAQALTISKEVKFDSEAEYFLRNEYQLVRP